MTEERYGDPRSQCRVPPPIGLARAQQMRFSPPEYQQARAWYQAHWGAHVNAGRPGPPGRLDGAEQDAYLMPSAADAGELLAVGVADQLEPCLAAAEDDLAAAERTIEGLSHWPDRAVTVDGRPWTLGEAAAELRRLSGQIQHDTDAGKLRHQPAPRALHRLSTVLLLLDLLAIVAAFVDLFDIDGSDLLGSARAGLAAIFLSVLLLAAQWLAARSAGRQWNVCLSRTATDPGQLDAARATLRRATGMAAAVVLPPTALLLPGLYDVAVDAGLGQSWRIGLCLLGLAIGLGAPLVTAAVVARDGSIDSRQRDALAEALADEADRADEAGRHAQDRLDGGRRHLDEYAGRLRPRVLHIAGSPLVETENALSLLHIMLAVGGGVHRPDDWRPRRPALPTDAPTGSPTGGAAVALPPLRWSARNQPEIDNEPLVNPDRTWAEQCARETALRTRLVDLCHAARPEQLPRTAVRTEPAAGPTGALVEDANSTAG